MPTDTDSLIPELERVLAHHAAATITTDRSDEIVGGVLTLSLAGDVHSRRPAIWLTAAAIAALGVAGIVAVTARRDASATPADHPVVSQPAPASSLPGATTAGIYPMFGDLGPLNATLHANAWHRDPNEPVHLRATIGQRTASGYTDIVHVDVLPTRFEWPNDVTLTAEPIAGRAVARYEWSGSTPGRGYTWQGDSTPAEIAITDSSITEQLVSVLRPGVDATGTPTLEIGQLPPGYDLIVGPTVDSALAGPDVGANDGQGGNVVLLVTPALLGTGDEWAEVPVGDATGWLSGPQLRPDGQYSAGLYWPTPNGQWAHLYGYGELADQLPEIANEVTWVDFDTFVATYGASPDDFNATFTPPTTVSGGPATTEVPYSGPPTTVFTG